MGMDKRSDKRWIKAGYRANKERIKAGSSKG